MPPPANEPELRAADLQALLEDVTATVRAMTPAQWGATVPGDGRTAAAVANHIVLHLSLATFAAGAAKGEAGPQASFTKEMLDGYNAAEAARNASIPAAKVLEALATQGPAAVAALRAIPAEAFDHTVTMTITGGTPVSVRAIVEGILLTDIRLHLDSLRAT
ncbi:MAG: maleylpyruvate isomerase N-terminal domain-containing protein [Chloroflexi bacterium]|nr:maleylpyruvate isomerase N-terminal domain-containing protein [Chloroflexota bacterium]